MLRSLTAGRSMFAAVDRRTLLGIGLAALAAFLVLVMTRPTPTTGILVADEDLPAGTPLEQLELSRRAVADPTGLVTAEDHAAFSSWSLRVPLSQGEPLPASLLEAPQLVANPDLISLELDAAHAVLGRLSAGDLVDIYATFPAGLQETPVTERIATEVYVVEARAPESTVAANRVQILLAVDADLAALLAAAVQAAEIDLVRIGSR